MINPKVKAGCGVITVFGLGFGAGVITLLILIVKEIPLSEGWKSDESKAFVTRQISNQLKLTEEQAAEVRPIVEEALEARWALRREYLLEDRGRLLLAIQHLLPRMLRGLTGRSTPCQVDCDDFHEIRNEQLRDLAQRVASEVRNRRRSRTLEPMSPDERRIVHLTLADDPAVETVSQGNGLFKRVQIRPQKMQPRGFDPFARE